MPTYAVLVAFIVALLALLALLRLRARDGDPIGRHRANSDSAPTMPDILERLADAHPDSSCPGRTVRITSNDTDADRFKRTGDFDPDSDTDFLDVFASALVRPYVSKTEQDRQTSEWFDASFTAREDQPELIPPDQMSENTNVATQEAERHSPNNVPPVGESGRVAKVA
ncbi:hypothetical protein JOF56_003717 [Kibdelosporangium banguiense]|uniref:Uncharacterized protein n=1 Tax=Kibdelosporangium banguiense TaxID=1365924 RepID=A0ABS4TFY7_9PSEU|nr:hypothetical protein [Kibdelosporangium banguiense]MBP2323332.1 hypothetical protein [Kibdelosporangium banguiense]